MGERGRRIAHDLSRGRKCDWRGTDGGGVWRGFSRSHQRAAVGGVSVRGQQVLDDGYGVVRSPRLEDVLRLAHCIRKRVPGAVKDRCKATTTRGSRPPLLPHKSGTRAVVVSGALSPPPPHHHCAPLAHSRACSWMRSCTMMRPERSLREGKEAGSRPIDGETTTSRHSRSGHDTPCEGRRAARMGVNGTLRLRVCLTCTSSSLLGPRSPGCPSLQRALLAAAAEGGAGVPLLQRGLRRPGAARRQRRAARTPGSGDRCLQGGASSKS